MEGLEMISFQIISCVGSAKSMYMEAAMAAQNYDFEKAEALKKVKRFLLRVMRRMLHLFKRKPAENL